MIPPVSRRTARASALLIVLWVVAVLSFIIVTALMVAMQDVETVSSRKAASRAKQLAEMGVAVASHPGVKPGDPLLLGKVSNSETYEAFITTEEGRLNLNALLNEERLPVLERLLGHFGLSPADAQGLAARLMDWTDPDDLKRRGDSAEKFDYRNAGVPGRPFNRPFRTLDEAVLVSGMEALDELRPDWRDFFTLRGNGQLDVNEASEDTLGILTGAPPHLISAFITARSGPDGIPHTKDDTPVGSVEEALGLLGVSADQVQTLTPLLTVRGTTLRIQSIGRAGDYARGISVVLRKDSGAPQVLEWREFIVE